MVTERKHSGVAPVLGLLSILLLAPGIVAAAPAPAPQPKGTPQAVAPGDKTQQGAADQTSGAAAAKKPEEGSTAAGTPGRVQPRLDPKGGGHLIVLDEEVIEGRIQKPEAFYILQRSNLNYKSLELDKSFVPSIVDSVKKSPF